jgi:hypothetical protein
MGLGLDCTDSLALPVPQRNRTQQDCNDHQIGLAYDPQQSI